MPALLSGSDIQRAVVRLAHEVAEAPPLPGARAGLVLLGIPTRGVPLASRLAAALRTVTGEAPVVGSLDITMYRDDLHMSPTRALSGTTVTADVEDRVVVLVDDVLFSGRTVRAALDALRDLGRPAAVRLVVLVDRGHRRLPVKADHVGRNIPTSLTQHVRVRLAEVDGSDGVDLDEGAP